MSLHEKLTELKKRLPYFKKESKGVHSQYVPEEAILLKVNDYLNANDVLLTPKIISSEVIGRIVHLTMEFVWSDGKEFIIVPWAAFGEDRNDISMAMGKALTYSNRYFLLKYFNIPTGKDDPDKYKAPEPKKKAFKGIIDEVFKNPNQILVEDLLALLEREKAPKKALDYYNKLEAEYYEKREQL